MNNSRQNINGRLPKPPQMSTATRVRLWTVVILLVAGYLLIRFGVGLYTDYLWFQHLDYESVFSTAIWAKLGVGLLVAVPFAVIFWI